MEAMALPKTLRPFAHIIDAVSDERASGDGYWVYLVDGLINSLTETHSIHEDTLAECAQQLHYHVTTEGNEQ